MMLIETERLKLKILTEAETELQLDFVIRNKAFFKKTEPLRTKEYFTFAYQSKFLRENYFETQNRTRLTYWLFKKDDPKIIGYICFSNIIYGNFKSCFLSYKLDKDEIAKGYMFEALKTAIKIVFKELKLHRIEANIMPWNKDSLILVKKLGFQEEGLAKKYLKINGKWEDHLHMVLLN